MNSSHILFSRPPLISLKTDIQTDIQTNIPTNIPKIYILINHRYIQSTYDIFYNEGIISYIIIKMDKIYHYRILGLLRTIQTDIIYDFNDKNNLLPNLLTYIIKTNYVLTENNIHIEKVNLQYNNTLSYFQPLSLEFYSRFYKANIANEKSKLESKPKSEFKSESKPKLTPKSKSKSKSKPKPRPKYKYTLKIL